MFTKKLMRIVKKGWNSLTKSDLPITKPNSLKTFYRDFGLRFKNGSNGSF